jgi:hypothetical protein
VRMVNFLSFPSKPNNAGAQPPPKAGARYERTL